MYSKGYVNPYRFPRDMPTRTHDTAPRNPQIPRHGQKKTCIFIYCSAPPRIASKQWPLASGCEQPLVALLRCGCVVCATAWCWSRLGFRNGISEHFSYQAQPRRLPSIANVMIYNNVGPCAAYSNARDATKSTSCTRLIVLVHNATNMTNPLLPTLGLKNAG